LTREKEGTIVFFNMKEIFKWLKAKASPEVKASPVNQARQEAEAVLEMPVTQESVRQLMEKYPDRFQDFVSIFPATCIKYPEVGSIFNKVVGKIRGVGITWNVDKVTEAYGAPMGDNYVVCPAATLGEEVIMGISVSPKKPGVTYSEGEAYRFIARTLQPPISEV
jgi:hypothetical protein